MQIYDIISLSPNFSDIFFAIRYPTRHAHRHEEVRHPPTLLRILDDDRELGEPFHRKTIDADDSERNNLEGKKVPSENRERMLPHEAQSLGTDSL